MKESVLANPKELEQRIREGFERLKVNQFTIAASDVAQRKKKLKKLHQTILNYRPQIKEALYLDFRKHPFEVDLTEIFTVTSELKHARRNLAQWMGRHSVGTPLAFFGSKSFIRYEPKGIVLILAPWNFPVTLTLGPLVSAVAAGNSVMIKPSEQTPNATYVLRQIIDEVFSPDEVMLIPGGIEESKLLLSLPFNHIFFTGSSKVGKIVMEAAAKNLASVTLELGGKSPTIVDESADIDQAARRIVWVKCINNGQICIAPDHVFVHAKVKEKFINAASRYLRNFYGADPATEPSYARLVNTAHFDRVKGFLENAVVNGGHIQHGGQTDKLENYIDPTLITNVNSESDLMQKEIFGPVLPIQTFQDSADLVRKLNQREKPLALYIYSRNKKNIKKILEGTRSGGTCINHSGIHFFNYNLPFGGSNFSGIGKAHGWFGFQAFSNARAVYHQVIPSALEILVPPYNRFKQRILDFTIKYL